MGERREGTRIVAIVRACDPGPLVGERHSTIGRRSAERGRDIQFVANLAKSFVLDWRETICGLRRNVATNYRVAVFGRKVSQDVTRGIAVTVTAFWRTRDVILAKRRGRGIGTVPRSPPCAMGGAIH